MKLPFNIAFDAGTWSGAVVVPVPMGRAGWAAVACWFGCAAAAQTAAPEASEADASVPAAVDPDAGAAAAGSDASALGDASAQAPIPIVDPFDPDIVHTLRLELDATALAILADGAPANEKVWAGGTLYAGGQIFSNIGVRRKGSSTFRAYPQKMALKLRFDRYVEGQRFHGLTDLTLNNMVSDRSQLRERLGYHVFRALGLPSPRANHVHLVLATAGGEEDFGLYTNVETPNRDLIARLHGAAARSLYEASTGDWTGNTGPLEDVFEEEVGDLDHADLLALQAAVNAATTENLLADVGAVLDTERWLRHCAAEAAIGHVDGYAYGYVGAHNYFLAGDTSGRFTLLPWSTDLTFSNDILDPLRSEVPGKANLTGEAITLLSRCKLSSACWSAYRTELLGVIDTVESLDLASLAASWHAQIAPYVQSPTFDPTMRLGARGDHGGGPGRVSYENAWNGSHQQLLAWIAARPAIVRGQWAPP